MKHRKAVILLFAGIFLVSVIPQVIAQDKAITERKDLMKSNNKASKAIKTAVEAKDYATIETNAKVIVANMDKVVELFPKGSTSNKSRAKAEIWEKWDEFSNKPAKVKTAAQALIDAAMAKDGDRVDAEYKAVGAACSSCHRTFRKSRRTKKKKK